MNLLIQGEKSLDREFVCLRGNHEEMLIRAASGDRSDRDLMTWWGNGGEATLKSYGVDDPSDLPVEHLAWMRSLRRETSDDHRMFVHAGIRPGVPLSSQSDEDLLWIREPFLSSEEDHGILVVHGHTPTCNRQPDVRLNRVNIDTGACFGGPLTAAVFVRDEVLPMFFIEDSGKISPAITRVSHHPKNTDMRMRTSFRSADFSTTPSSGPEWHVTVLPYGGGKRWLAEGIDDLLAIDRSRLTSVIHQRVYDATVTGEAYHDVEGARSAMEGWAYPRTWIDFETVSFASPRWTGTHPNQAIPFQFSAHVEQSNGSVEHREFLSLDGNDPRRTCAEALLEAVPSTGAVIAYNVSFERSCVIRLANAFPDLEDKLRSIASRLVDLHPVTRDNWYHRDQRGKWSIKAVLPTVAGELGYAHLEVKDGKSIGRFYREAIAVDTSASRRQAIDAALRAYCGLDTRAMMVVAAALLGNQYVISSAVPRS